MRIIGYKLKVGDLNSQGIQEWTVRLVELTGLKFLVLGEEDNSNPDRELTYER